MYQPHTQTMNMARLVAATALLLFLAVGGQAVAQSAIGTVTTLSGMILDQATLLPVEANYGVFDAQGKKIGQSRVASATDGYLVTGLKPGSSYSIRVEDPRYLKQEFSVTMPPSGTYSEVSKDITVRKLVAGTTYAMNPVPFDLKKTDIKDGTEDDVRSLAQLLVMNPSVRIQLVCYPDEEMPAKRSEELSLQRANALKAFLQKEGVVAERISVKAAQSTDPLNPPPLRKGAKGKRYIGSVYITMTDV